MACYLPDHLVRCLVCKDLFSDARRLRCGCVYCYLCCLKLIKNSTLYCQCSSTHHFKSDDEIEKSLVIDNVVNDLVRQYIKQKNKSVKKLVDYDSNSLSSQIAEEEWNADVSDSLASSNLCSVSRKQVAVAQPPCTICKKKSNTIVLCEHCKSDICELCMEKHYQMITDMLQNKWMQCKEKFNQINEYVSSSHQNKAIASVKLDAIRKTVEERSKNLKLLIDNHRQILVDCIDNYIENLENVIKADEANNQYQSVKNRLPKLLQEETNATNLLAFYEETEKLLDSLTLRNKQLQEMEAKILYLSQSDSKSINISHLIGELKIDDKPLKEMTPNTSLTTDSNQPVNSNNENLSSLIKTPLGQTHSPRHIRSNFRPRGNRGGQYSTHSMGFYPRNNRFNGHYPYRGGRTYSRSCSTRYPSRRNNFDVVPNDQYVWSLDLKEIPCFLSVLDNRNRSSQPDTCSHHRHPYMLFVADDYGRIEVYNLPQTAKYAKPSIIGTGELFSKNSHLLLESFAVCEYAIVVYVRRFEQRSNEIEHSKLIKAGLPIMKGEQGRCNDHGGMIYLFTHDCNEIDGVYQSHPIRTILADQSSGCLWALNPMQKNVYSYMMPTSKDDIHKCFQEEEIVLDFLDEDFEPSSMIQSKESIGLIDSENDSYRLYAKDDKFRLISTYENVNSQKWKLTDGVIFKDNRTLLKLIEDKSYDDEHTDRNNRNRFHNSPRRCLLELTPDGQEKRQIQADTLYCMAMGPNDEVILGFATRGDHGLIHCY